MDLGFFFFKVAPAIQLIFRYGFIPKEEDFKELTPAQYMALHRHADEEEELAAVDGRKLFALLPDDIQSYNRVYELYGEQLAIVTADEVSAFSAASSLFDKCCKGKDFATLQEKLEYMARTLPPEFTADTPYAILGRCKTYKSSPE